VAEFSHASPMPVSAAQLFAWHARPGAFQRLQPPWETIRRVTPPAALRNGALVELTIRRGPFAVRWQAQLRDVEPERQFVDEQVRGPFAKWTHRHRFIDEGRESILEDHVEYELPGGSLGRRLAGGATRRRLERLFAYRHERTRRDLARHDPFRERPRLRVLLSGASGLIGAALTAFLDTGGHACFSLVRRAPRSEREIQWDPAAGRLDAARLERFDACVHLSGENIASGRWTAARKRRLRESRINSTSLLAATLARLARPPATFICASAIGYYGDRGDEALTEASRPGDGFLPDVCRAWEAATTPASEVGVRVINLRTGIVLTRSGGALAAMLWPFRLGLGGVVGSGRQWMSWIALDDLIGLIHFTLMNEELRGPVNAVAPRPVTNREFTRTLGRVLRRPTWTPLPALAVRGLLGEMGDALLLQGQRVTPEAAGRAGFEFMTPTLDEALRWEMGLLL